jgi:hypothetical protein
MSDGTTTDWGALGAVITAVTAALGLLWKIGMDGRNAIHKRLAETEQTADDDRKQVRQLESEIARNYVSKADFAALDGRIGNGLSDVSRKVDGLSTEVSRKFDDLYRMLMERGSK